MIKNNKICINRDSVCPYTNGFYCGYNIDDKDDCCLSINNADYIKWRDLLLDTYDEVWKGLAK